MPAAIQHQSKRKLLDAAQDAFRTKGYAATTVHDICHLAGVTKGSFFHHFKSKEDLTLAAAAHWNAWTEELFASAPYHQLEDPLDRILGYIDLRIAILDRPVPEFTCLLGTLVQETYETHPSFREVCDAGMSSHIAKLTTDLELAKKRYAAGASWSAESVGYFIQAVLQGSFIFAKAKHSAETARENLGHLRRYLKTLFPQSTKPN